MVYGWREGAKWGLFAPLYSLAGPQNRTYFDLSDSFRREILGNWASGTGCSRKLRDVGIVPPEWFKASIPKPSALIHSA